MIGVIQRVQKAQVEINGSIYSNIQEGLLVLLGITHADEQADADWLANKVCGLRIFSDENGKMNKSLADINGELLIVSQFTLLANTQKGNRPSYIRAAKPDIAIPLYESFIKQMELELEKQVQQGKFGADMKVSLLNDGPVTIIIDTKNKE